MIFITNQSRNKIVHSASCHYLKNKTKKTLSFANLQTAQRQGYRLCKKCSPLHKKWKTEKERIFTYAQKQTIQLSYDDVCVNVRCGNEQWKILSNTIATGIVLYHKNATTHYNDEYVPHYHKQSVRCRSLLGALQYIYSHFLYRKNNPVVLSKPQAPERKHKRHKKRANKQERNSNILNLLKSLHSEDVYKDFLCYLT